MLHQYATRTARVYTYMHTVHQSITCKCTYVNELRTVQYSCVAMFEVKVGSWFGTEPTQKPFQKLEKFFRFPEEIFHLSTPLHSHTLHTKTVRYFFIVCELPTPPTTYLQSLRPITHPPKCLLGSHHHVKPPTITFGSRLPPAQTFHFSRRQTN